MKTNCSVCGSTRNFGRFSLRQYCSSACKQFAYRQRKLANGFSIYRGYFYASPDLAGQGGNQ
jgi:hypothetical protein